MDSLYHRIRDRIRHCPNRIAYIDGERQVTYRELGARVDDLAAIIGRRGVGAETVIAVCTQQPQVATVAVLAIWATGSAYMPLDSDFPDSVLRSWVSHTGVETIITDTDTVTRIEGLCSTPPVLADLGDVAPETTSRGAVFTGPTHPRSLAYVVHTSGSTGAHKSVAVEHHNLLSYRDALLSRVRLEPEHRVLQLAAFTYDAWLRDALIPLTADATVVLQPKSARRNPDRVLAALHDNAATHLLCATPALLSGLLTAASFGSLPPALTMTLVSGESFVPLHAFGSDLLRFGTLVNQYGLTETTLTAMWCPMTVTVDAAVDEVGRPLPGLTVHLLDSRLRPVAPGEIGEIYLGGDRSCRGYLGAPAMTAHRFVADPTGVAGGRLCRTGDLGRQLPDGSLECLGRGDRQIKLRGHRVEPAQVELALRCHPAVRSAVVMSHQRPRLGTALIAYVVASDAAVSAETLRTHLGTRLPAYMIPAAYTFLDTLPLGATGKVDRSALPAPTFGSGASQPPRNAVEQAITDIWSDLFEVSAVGRTDNFFDMGGHSLLAAELASRLTVALRRAFTTEHVLRHPTPDALASALPAEPRDNTLVRRSGVRYPLSLVQHGLLAQHTAAGGPVAPGAVAVRAFRLIGPLDVDRLNHAVQQVVAAHSMLRCVFETRSGTLTQTVRHRMSTPIRSSTVTADAAADLGIETGSARIDLAAGPLLDVEVLELGREHHMLMVRCHRIAADEHSLDLLIRDIGRFYSAASAPAPIERPVGYPTYIQSHPESADAAASAFRWWQTALDQTAPVAVDAAAERSEVRLELSRTIIRALRGLAHRHRLQTAEVLRVAYAAAIVSEQGDGPVILAAPTARPRPPELETVVGPFAATHAGLVVVDGDVSLPALLRAYRSGDGACGQRHPVPLEYLCGVLKLPTSVLANRFSLRRAAAMPELSGLVTSSEDVPVVDVHTAHRLDLVLHEDGVRGRLVGSGGADHVQRMADGLVDMLSGAVLLVQ